MHVPHDGFRDLQRRACQRLLAKIPVGRIVYTRPGLPAVLPVDFCPETDGAVPLRTAAVSEPARVIDGAVVAFEADEVDAATHSAWGVVVTGTTTVVTYPAERKRLAHTDSRLRVPSPREVFIRIEAELVTGRDLADGGSMYGPALSI
ncbi:pyridoxamine 5'-phosphate oxidase family protein [Streptomyces sp. KS_5]|uniref:pyridoxamine 5'-phosphate oxidase family protein n=1 Tax=Streptomyces TaxID=1883 RepID=UPI000B8751C9|nr:pyridoxamine 5'-phosphate oxidase family protein [Streptomyces sp. KS_5]